MSVLPKLASALGRRDMGPNIKLAEEIAKKGDKKSVKELIDALKNKSKDIQNDSIKVLYEIGEKRPELICDYSKEFISLLDDKNNRLQWGAMTALNCIASLDPKTIYAALSKIISVGENGSVITRDHTVAVLIKLGTIKQYADNAFAMLNEQLKKCPTNQLPMYAEKAVPIINAKNKPAFIKTLTSRLDDIDKDTKRKRVEKVIKVLS
ncbi:MAG: hypothetical protein H0U95_07855 [Bacteroidetes bacterium]|nr:hypothetical protein [Bacteroidota bacterium]